MLILIKSHYKVSFEEIYSSIIEHDVVTSKIPFLITFASGVYVLIFFSMYARPNSYTEKVHF